MTNKQFLERLEEILDWARFEQEWIATEVKDHDPKTEHEKTCGVCIKMRVLNEKATQSLITLFEDFTDAIAGEKYPEPDEKMMEEYRKVLGEDSKQYIEMRATKTANLIRQTINQTSKTILKGESDEL